MGGVVLGPGRGWFDASPLGKHRIVELLPFGWIGENLGKARHLSGETTLPGCDVDQVLPEGPFATDLPQKIIPGFDREVQVGEHNMKPRPTITKQVKKWLALHAVTVSKKACSLQSSYALEILAGDWRLMTGDFLGRRPRNVP